MAYPVRAIARPSELEGATNGQLPASALVTTPGLAGGVDVRLIAPAARAWRALCAAALKDGHTLKAVGPADSYRPYEVQERIFRQRYQLTPLSGRPTKTWNGRVWYQLPRTAIAAVPGTSNHGWGITVDTGEENDGDAGAESLDDPTLGWLLANEERFGWSHELQSEPWHIRYFAGDQIPQAVLDFEAGHNDEDPEDDDMVILIPKVPGAPDHDKAFLVHGGQRRHLAPEESKGLRDAGVRQSEINAYGWQAVKAVTQIAKG